MNRIEISKNSKLTKIEFSSHEKLNWLYKSRFCAMRWAVGSTIKTLLKVTLFSFTFAVLYHLYFVALNEDVGDFLNHDICCLFISLVKDLTLSPVAFMPGCDIKTLR